MAVDGVRIGMDLLGSPLTDPMRGSLPLTQRRAAAAILDARR
jgi:hypothetical protein